MWKRSAEFLKRSEATPLWIAALLLWLWVAAPLISGHETLFYRDVLSTHAHFKAFGAEELRQGRIPAFNSTWALGQPFRGNPNTVAFYPGNLLYAFIPFSAAFHLHYMVHWLLALGSMWLLARQLGQSRLGALCAGLTYAGSGWLLSALTFYNILTLSAWWPLVLWGMARGDRRGLMVGGVACGLAFLGGEPVTLIVGLVPLAALAWQRHGVRRGLGRLAILGTLALLVALPQIVATLRVIEFTFRGGHGLLPGTTDAFSLHPVRLLELFVPLPFGSPAMAGPEGFWTIPQVPRVPYIVTIHFGIVGLVLALVGGRRQPFLGALALAGLLAAWLGGALGDLLWTLSQGLFRYPEKFLFWFALTVPLLTGWGVDGLARSRGSGKGIAVAASLMLVMGGLFAWFSGDFIAAVANSMEHSAAGGAAALAGLKAHAFEWTFALFTGGALLALLATAVWTGHRRMLVALQFLSLLGLSPLLMRADSDLIHRPGPFAQRLPEGSGVVSSMGLATAWDQDGLEVRGPQSLVTRAWVESLSSPSVVLQGVNFPMGRDLEGMHSPLFSLMDINLGHADWPTRITWCRALGANALVTSQAINSPHLRQLWEMELYGMPYRLYEVLGTAPTAWWPAETSVAESPVEAFIEVSRRADPVNSVVAGQAIEHRADAKVRVLLEQPDRLEIAVQGDGGVLAVRRAYQPLWRARSGDKTLETFPINLNLLGVRVPPGEQRVVLDVSSWPELLAGLVSLLAVAAACLISLRGRRLEELA